MSVHLQGKAHLTQHFPAHSDAHLALSGGVAGTSRCVLWLPGDLFASHLCHLSCIRPMATLSTRECYTWLFFPTSGLVARPLPFRTNADDCVMCWNFPPLYGVRMSSCKMLRFRHQNLPGLFILVALWRSVTIIYIPDHQNGPCWMYHTYTYSHGPWR